MLGENDRKRLLDVAQASVSTGVDTGRPSEININDYPEIMQENASSFVTLHHNGMLRGCIGNLQASRPMVDDINHNAFAAAFRDHRFSPVTAIELPDLSYHISLLSPTEPMSFTSRSDLLQQLRPGIDGIVITSEGRRATFLPAVWENLSNPETFIEHLMNKAGVPADHWSDDIKIDRYTVEEF